MSGQVRKVPSWSLTDALAASTRWHGSATHATSEEFAKRQKLRKIRAGQSVVAMPVELRRA